VTIQTQLAQEKLDYIRRREAREANEYNKKEQASFTKAKAEKAFVRFPLLIVFVAQTFL